MVLSPAKKIKKKMPPQNSILIEFPQQNPSMTKSKVNVVTPICFLLPVSTIDHCTAIIVRVYTNLKNIYITHKISNLNLNPKKKKIKLI
jgi:hypothetical protein